MIEDILEIPARMHLRGPRKVMEPSIRLIGKATGNPV